MVEIPRCKLLGMTMAVFGFFTTLSRLGSSKNHPPAIHERVERCFSLGGRFAVAFSAFPDMLRFF
jgi:hypothetical protein